MRSVITGDDDAAVRWQSSRPPDNEVPGTVPVGAVVTRTDAAALVLHRVLVHGNGLLLELSLLLRVEPDLLAGRGHGPAGGLLVGLELGDGTAVVQDRQGSSDGPTLSFEGSTGGGREVWMRLWLHPRPVPGDVVVHAAGPEWGLPEGAVVVPGADLAQADARRTTLWPWEPVRARHHRPPPPPEPPAGGWFARVLASRVAGPEDPA